MDNENVNVVNMNPGEFNKRDSEYFEADYFANDFFSGDEEHQEYNENNDKFKEEVKGKGDNDDIFYTDKLDYEEDFESQKEEDVDTDVLKIHAEDDYVDLGHDIDEMRNTENFSSSNNVINQSSNEPSTSSVEIEVKKQEVEGLRVFATADVASSEPSAAAESSTANPTGFDPSAAGPYWCHICNVQTTAQKNLEIHYTGSKHKKKQERYEMIKQLRMQGNSSVIKVTDTNKLICSVCDIDLTLQIIDDHLTGVKHLGNIGAIPPVVTKQEVEGSGVFVTADVASSEPSTANSTTAEPCTANPTDADPSAVEPDPACINLKVKYWCNICKVSNNSPKGLNIHYNGSKHKKKQKGYEMMKQIRMLGDSDVIKFTGTNKLKCSVCDIDLTLNCVDDHLRGVKHLGNIGTISTVVKPRAAESEAGAGKGITIAPAANLLATYGGYRCEICKNTFQDKAIHLSNPNHKEKENRYNQIKKIVENNNCLLQRKDNMVCLCCNVRLEGQGSLKQHLNGRKHREMPKKDSAIMRKLVEIELCLQECLYGEIECVWCHMKLSNPWMVKQHLNGDMHITLCEEIQKLPKNNIAAADVVASSSGSSRIITTDHNEEIQQDYTKRKVCLKYIPKDIPDCDLQKILWACGKHFRFKRILEAGTCSVLYDEIESALRCERLLHNCPIMNFKIQVVIPYKDSILQKERRKIVNKDLDNRAISYIRQLIYSTENKHNNKDKKMSGSRSPIRRKRRSASRSPDRKIIRSRSRSTDRYYRKSRSKSIDRKYRRSRSRERSHKISENLENSRVRKRRSASRSPDRKMIRSRSRSTDRYYRKSRSKSIDRKYRRSRSRERSHKRSENLENSRVRKRRFGSRSSSNEAKFDKRSRSNELEKSKESTNVLSEGVICDTDIAILDKENIIVTSIMTPIFNECGGKQHLCDLNKMVYRFETQLRARVVYKLLNKFRTPLGRAKLVYSQKVDTRLPEDSQETIQLMGIINETLKKYRQISIEILKELGTQKNKIDPYIFKTEKCAFEVCQNRMKCTFYHNREQIRRNPSKIVYFPHRCSEYHLGSCILGSMCTKCHSDYELNFHPDMIHKIVCSDWYRKGPCKFDFDSLDCCINAHPETPEVLFNDAWHDLYVAELKHTYQYLVGAIQNLRFVDTQQQGIYILLVTPSIYMIHWLIEAIQDLVTALRFDVHMIASDTNITEKEKKSQVVLCTPDGAIKLLEIPGVSTSLTLAGLILDDVTLLLHRHKNELETIGKAVMYSTPCLVAVADKVYKQDVSKLSALLYTQFNIIGKVSSSPQEKDFPSSVTIDSTLSSSSNIRQNESSTDTETQKRNIYESSTVTDTKKNNKYIEKAQNPREYSATEACRLLRGFCDQIGILGISLKMTLEKTEFENDSYKIFESLSDADSQELLVLISNKFVRLKDETHDSILKSKYIQACIAAKFLVDSTRLYLEFKSKLGLDKQHSRTVSETGKIDNENGNTSRSSSLSLNSDFVMDNPPKFDSSKPFTQEEVKLFHGIVGSSSSSLNSDFVMDNTQQIDSSKLTQEELMLFQGILDKNKNYGLPSSPQRVHQRSKERSCKDGFRDSENEVSSNSASHNPISISEMMDEIGENLDLNISLNIPQRTHDKNPGRGGRPDDTNQSSHYAGFSPSKRDFSQRFMDRMFKVAIFGHEYIEVLPFNSGETFKSKNPDNPYQVIKYVKYGAEIFKIHEYDIWKGVISAQPNMIFLVLGKNDISEYLSSQNIANRMVKIKSDLEKGIPNVRIVCFGLENRDSDSHWSSCQDKLNRCLGAWFETIIFPTNNVDIGDSSYEAVTKVWRYMQEIIEDIKVQHYMLCKSKDMQSKDVGMKDMLSRYIDMLN